MSASIPLPLDAAVTISYHTVLHDHGLRDHAATDQERSLATECAQLRTLLSHGACHHDVATLRNVQVQKNKVVASALAFVDDLGDDKESLAQLVADARELRRITTCEVTA